MSTPAPVNIIPRTAGRNIWLSRADANAHNVLKQARIYEIKPEVIDTEEGVGRAMLAELERAAAGKIGELNIALLGGRGAQAMHRLLGERARSGDPDGLIARLNLFTQDALAPMRVDNGFSFVRDFERLLGMEFFRRAHSFTQMRTDASDLQTEVTSYVQQLEAMGGLDIFFLGLGPEAGGASHLAYIKPNSSASATDVAGIIPISSTILEHHVTKFKAGGSSFAEGDEDELRRATHILTLGPAAILNSKRIVQSVVDAETAPGKRVSYRRVLETEISDDIGARARQLDENPGLWTRLHPNVKSLILPNVL